jgi:hypothetical protein
MKDTAHSKDQSISVKQVILVLMASLGQGFSIIKNIRTNRKNDFTS